MITLAVACHREDPLLVQLREALPLVDCQLIAEMSADALATTRIAVGEPACLATYVEQMPALEWVQSTWAGVKPLIDSSARHYRLTGVKDVFGPAMSAYVLAWVLSAARDVSARLTHQRWHPEEEPALQGRRMGIMGTGSIGLAVAQSARQVGLEVVGLNRTGISPGDAFTAVYSLEDRLAFASGVDYLVALLPDTPQTTDLIDADLLAALNPDAMVINAGRGNCLDESALLTAIEGGHIQQAVLDVFREEPLPEVHPFWHTAGVVVTSHTAAPTPVSAALAIFLDNLTRFQSAESLRYEIDWAQGY